jgi:mRNA interferase RelE/StbE
VASFRIVIRKSAARELDDVRGKKDRQRIVTAIRRLADDPRPHGVEKLSGTRDRYRIRVENFRVLYEIEDEVLLIYVVKVGDRKDVYRRRT